MISNEDQLIERKVTTPIITKAHKKSIELGSLNNSITNGEGNLVGFVGEGLLNEYLLEQGQMSKWSNTYEYDIVLNGDITIDVKSKKTNFIPKLDYECSVAALNTKQACDVYVFTRVKGDMSIGWILGFLPKKDYFDLASLMKKGMIDPSNGWKVKTDCYQVPINKLRPINDLFEISSNS